MYYSIQEREEYIVDKDSFLEKVKELGTLEDIVTLRDKLTELTDEVLPVFEKDQNLEEENNKFKEDNEKLREANMKLFLRVGEERNPESVIKDKTGIEEDKPPRKYEDLFDDKGNLK